MERCPGLLVLVLKKFALSLFFFFFADLIGFHDDCDSGVLRLSERKL